jgi:hypothetical protein
MMQDNHSARFWLRSLSYLAGGFGAALVFTSHG